MGEVDAQVMPIYDHLIGTHPETGEQNPQLATSWTVAGDGMTYTWKLRDNVPFYKDGKPTNYVMTSKDVLLSMELKAGFKTKSTVAAFNWLGTETVDADISKNNEITVRLTRINLDMPYLMTDQWPMGIVSLDHWNDKGGEEGYVADPIGNGSWTLIEFKNNVHSLLKRADNHYRKTPEFPEAEFLFSAEAATRLAMILAKEVHIAALPRDLHGQAENSGMVVYKSTLPGAQMKVMIPWYLPDNYIDPKTGKPAYDGAATGPTKAYDVNDPLRNIKVREALNLAINRDEINKVFFNGEGFPLVDYFPPWQKEFQDEWAPIPGPNGKIGKDGGWPLPYDPARAKQLLTEAGYPNGFETTLNAINNQPVALEQADVGEAITKYWEAIGVKVKFNSLELAQAVDVWFGRTNPNTSMLVSFSTGPLCEAMTFVSYNSGLGFWDWPEISAFLESCATVTDSQVRDRETVKLGTWWVKNFPSAPIVWVFGYAVVDPSVVQEYRVNMLHQGPVRYHEYTKPVYK
jgi:ABC-type transport system substrate-binding protein